MATDNTPAAEGEAESDDKRRPYVVVLMSEDMKAALKEYAQAHNTTPTALLRVKGAEAIGYALEDEPQPTSRAKYKDDAERDAAHKLASKKSGLLRKALFQVHYGMSHSKPALADAAQAVVLNLSEPGKRHTFDELETLDASINAAAKAK